MPLRHTVWQLSNAEIVHPNALATYAFAAIFHCLCILSLPIYCSILVLVLRAEHRCWCLVELAIRYGRFDTSPPIIYGCLFRTNCVDIQLKYRAKHRKFNENYGSYLVLHVIRIAIKQSHSMLYHSETTRRRKIDLYGNNWALLFFQQ